MAYREPTYGISAAPPTLGLPRRPSKPTLPGVDTSSISSYGEHPAPAAEPNLSQPSQTHRLTYNSNTESPHELPFSFSTPTYYSITFTTAAASFFVSAVKYLTSYLWSPFAAMANDPKKHGFGESGSPATDDRHLSPVFAYGSSDLSANMRSRRLSHSIGRTPSEKIEVEDEDLLGEVGASFAEKRQAVVVQVPGHPDRNGIWTCSCPGHFV